MNKPGALDFTDYIKRLPSQWIIEHFLQKAEGPRKILSSSMIEDTVAEFSSPESLQRLFLQLPSELQLRCALVYLSGDHGITIGVSNAFEDPLLLTFLTYAASTNQGTVRIFGFHQFEKHLHTEFIKVLRGAATVEHLPAPSETFPGRVLNDITTIAGLCLQGQITKKRNGGISRASLILLKKLVDAGIGLKSEKSEYAYTIAIAYLKKKKLLIETETGYQLILPAFSRWLTEKMSVHLHEIETFCFEYSGGWNRELFLGLIKTNANNWISAKIFPPQDLEDAIDTLHSLWFCGLIELKRKGDEVVFCKARHAERQAAEQKKRIIVMPDFSSIIPQEIDPAELFSFNELGVLQSLDRVYWGKISKQYILNSCTRGVDPAQIMKLLTAWNAPSNVVETVREWIREFLRLYIADQSLLVSSDEKVTMQINAYEPIRSYLEPVNAHAVFRIRKGSEENVREILQNLGFDTRMPGQDKYVETEQPVSEEFINPVKIWVPVTEVEKVEEQAVSPMRGTKYGSEMKVLDTSEIVHVIDYAILTGATISFDYEGSPYLKPGLYTVKPLSFQKGIDPAFEGELTRTKSKKMFYLKKIRKIGVLQR